MPWTTAQIPDQTGRTTVITGATSGIGLEASKALAAKGATLILAVRDTARGEAAAAEMRAAHPRANIEVRALDLASLASVRAFAERVIDLPRIDVLLNNAGLGLQPQRAVTADGFERQFATNHLGHFALTGLLMPVLLRAEAPRVVTISSIAHRRGRMHWDDLQFERNYQGRPVYEQSKLANLMFAQELAARSTEAGSALASLAAHPGVALTGFMKATGMPAPVQLLFNAIGLFAFQSGAAGALPGLYAATMPDAKNGDYWGPDGFMEIRGAPARARIWPHARDRADWRRLWSVSEDLTGVKYPF